MNIHEICVMTGGLLSLLMMIVLVTNKKGSYRITHTRN